MADIYANMVIRNERGNYLERVLTRLQDQVDVICITDDCSDDGTFEFAASFPKVRIQRIEEPLFRVDEGKLRQQSWTWLESQLNDPSDTMVLAIDADEELYESGPTLRFLAGLRHYDVFNIMFFHMWNEEQFRIDGGWRPHGSSRFFRYYPGGTFANRRLACGSEPTYVPMMIRSPKYMVNTGLFMKHLSYIKDVDKQIKYDRYTAIDGGAFHANAHIQSIMDPPDRVVLQDWKEVIHE